MSNITAHTRFDNVVVEVIGPAGAGKTTLVRALRHQGVPVRDQRPLGVLERTAELRRVTRTFLPSYLRGFAHSRFFNLEEMRRLIYVRSWQRAITRPPAADGSITILDHGPIFMMGMLLEFGPELVASAAFEQWLDESLQYWGKSLHWIIWLDAPNDQLVHRVEERQRYHAIKGRSHAEACAYLNRCRRSFDRLLSRINISGGPEILRFQTDLLSPDDMATRFLERVTRLAKQGGAAEIASCRRELGKGQSSFAPEFAAIVEHIDPLSELRRVIGKS